jgi:hypothetical protein
MSNTRKKDIFFSLHERANISIPISRQTCHARRPQRSLKTSNHEKQTIFKKKEGMLHIRWKESFNGMLFGYIQCVMPSHYFKVWLRLHGHALRNSLCLLEWHQPKIFSIAGKQTWITLCANWWSKTLVSVPNHLYIDSIFNSKIKDKKPKKPLGKDNQVILITPCHSRS